MRALRRLGLFSFVVLLAFWAADRAGDPSLQVQRDGQALAPVLIVSHGYHAGIILRREDMLRQVQGEGFAPLRALIEHFPSDEFLEIGWGEENFYRNVPRLSFGTAPAALKALFWPDNVAVLHIVGFSMPPQKAFSASRILVLELGTSSMHRLIGAIQRSVTIDGSGSPIPLGPGLYGPSQFFKAEGRFSIASVCNHWVAGLLNEAGMSINMLAATLPSGLMEDLYWRSGGRWLHTP